jgi:hypothetical protein
VLKYLRGGGINRFKQHLAGAKGEVEQCRKCPPDVRYQMVLNLKGNAEKKKRVREMQVDFNPFNAQQREHEEMMIRHLKDDDVVMMMMMRMMRMSILKNMCYHRRLQKRKRFKAPAL